MQTLIYDIETNGLTIGKDCTKIHMLCVWQPNVNGQQPHAFVGPDQIREGISQLNKADIIVGHNVIAYDNVVLRHFFPEFQPIGKIIDTLVVSRVLHSDIKSEDWKFWSVGKLDAKYIGRHNLASWGQRLNFKKNTDFGDNTDWSTCTKEMIEYCIQDVKVTGRLYNHFKQSGFDKKWFNLEHSVAYIIQQQKETGIVFNTKKAQALIVEITGHLERFTKKLQKQYGKICLPKGKVVNPKRSNKKRNIVADHVYQNIKFVTFNPISRDHVGLVLQRDYGWKPEERTATGKPKIDEHVLENLTYPGVEDIITTFVLNKRLGLLSKGAQSWLHHVDSDGRIHGSVITNGAVTGRMSHKNPNLAQVPRIRYSEEGPLYGIEGKYGFECRDLFQAGPGNVLVGCDASGLELRMLAHYMFPYEGGPEYAKEVVEGDIHTTNMYSLGITNRDVAKTFIYAFIYGAGEQKLADVLGVLYKEGVKKKKQFLEHTPALLMLQKQIFNKLKKRRYLRGLDGRRLPIRNDYSALNTLIQSAGAVLMKEALVLLDHKIKSKLYQAKFVLNVHDEWQLEVKKEDANAVAQAAVSAIQLAGQSLMLRVPMDGEAKIGRTWAETH